MKPTALGSILYHICFLIYYLPLLFSDLLFQKPKNTFLHFLFTYFNSRFIEIYLSNLSQLLSHQLDNFWHHYPKGIGNPFHTSGCKYLFFVCRYRLHCVAWFDNLGLIAEGNTYRRCAASSLPLWGNTDVVRAT